MNKGTSRLVGFAAVAVALTGFAPWLRTGGSTAVASPRKPVVAAWLPNPQFTPGVADARLTDAVLRAPGFTTKNYRPSVSVTDKLKAQAMNLYGIPVTPANMKAYEGDHLMSLEVGGATDIHNFWPEPWNINVNGFDLGAHTKDRLEDYLGKQVRLGQMSGATARALLAGDWTIEYETVFGALPRYVGPTSTN
jgi:hypothetical protein